MEEVYRIALSMVPGIGNIGAKRLIDAAGSAEEVFSMGRKRLLEIPGLGNTRVDRILDGKVISQAHAELEYIRKNNIRYHIYNQDEYPERLSFCEDAPSVLYVNGKMDLYGKKTLAVVGTRRPSVHGLETCRRLISDLAERYPELVIVSGLAYGIDKCAHNIALEKGLETIAVLGHGMKFMYPAAHRGLAARIMQSGALVSDFPSNDKPEKQNFIKRNRIIAGLSEATIVVESGIKGGALITADLANSYNRDVFAFPGRVSDPSSAGCNRLIKSHRAALIEDFRDVEYLLGWESRSGKPGDVQQAMFRELTPEEDAVIKVLQSEGDSSVDLLCYRTGFPVSKISGVLLNMELSGLIRAIPGDSYCLCRP